MSLTFPKEFLSQEGPLKNEKVINITPIHGGSIHNAWRLELKTGQQLFAKTSTEDKFAMLEYEAKGLKKLNEIINKKFLTVPQPLITQRLNKGSILLMPWLEFGEGDEINLGKGLALLHKDSAKESPNCFGWESNGFIGYNTQISGWSKSWGECFVKLRLTPQIKLAEKWGLNFKSPLFYSRLIKYLEQHNPQPSLVHGDLWNGNTAVDKNGKGVIFDPAVWWADREVDIAMTKLFGGFSNIFYESYQATWKLNQGFKERIDIYNLYHLLNHANMFGGTYKNNAISSINKINIFLEQL